MAAKRAILRHLLIYAGVTPFVIFAVFPVAWMAVTAFKQDADLYRVGQAPFWFHRPPTLEHFERLFAQTYFTTQLLNTLWLSALRRRRLPAFEKLGFPGHGGDARSSVLRWYTAVESAVKREIRAVIGRQREPGHRGRREGHRLPEGAVARDQPAGPGPGAVRPVSARARAHPAHRRRGGAGCARRDRGAHRQGR